MALPKLNQAPNYELTIPSTGEKIQYRPFLVKEQKILLLALESQDQKQILRTIRDTLAACIVGEYNVNALKIFDVEYIFLQMRSKAVGENTSLPFKCGKCEKEHQVNIPISEINIKINDDIKYDVAVTDQYNLKLSYPLFSYVIESEINEEETQSELVFRTAKMCLHSLQTEDENILFADESAEEIEEFFGSLTGEQFGDIMKFAESVPTVKYDASFKCTKCGDDNEIKLQGIQDFF